MLAPLSTLTKDVKLKLNIDLDACEKNRQKLVNASLEKKLADVFSKNEFEQSTDPDLMLYGGGFFSATDARNMAEIRRCSKDELSSLDLAFEDERLEEMLFRYRCRNYPETMNKDESAVRQLYRKECLTVDGNGGRLTLMRYFEILDELIIKDGWTEKQQELLDNLISYGETLSASLEA